MPDDEACVASDFVAIVPVEPVAVLLFGTVAEPAFDAVEGPLIEPEEAAGFGAVLPGVVPVAVGSPAEPVGAGVGLAVCAQAMPAVIKTAAEASKSERMGLSLVKYRMIRRLIVPAPLYRSQTWVPPWPPQDSFSSPRN
jgi:hypothetical protein